MKAEALPFCRLKQSCFKTGRSSGCLCAPVSDVPASAPTPPGSIHVRQYRVHVSVLGSLSRRTPLAAPLSPPSAPLAMPVVLTLSV